MFSYFLSDLHIGVNDTVNWYQQSVHQNLLKHILSWITAKGNQTEDLVILGDWFDTWEYTPAGPVYPSAEFAEKCIQANSGLFTPCSDGDFVTLANSIAGNVWYINGNHDMDISVDTVNDCLAPYLKGKKILGNSDPYANTIYTSEDGRIYAEHGHLYSLMCRPDNKSSGPYVPLPLGYYVSRTASQVCFNTLAKQKLASAAELPDSGSPVFGTVQDHLDDIIRALENQSSVEEFAPLFLSLLVALTGTVNLKDIAYHMTNGAVPSGTDAAAWYEWMKTSDVLSFSTPDGIAFMSADVNNSLDNAGRRLCDAGHPIVIMGHTHVPYIEKRLDSGYVYANTGYLCPDIPGMKDGTKNMSFIELETKKSSSTVRIMKVDYTTGAVSRDQRFPEKTVRF